MSESIHQPTIPEIIAPTAVVDLAKALKQSSLHQVRQTLETLGGYEEHRGKIQIFMSNVEDLHYKDYCDLLRLIIEARKRDSTAGLNSPVILNIVDQKYPALAKIVRTLIAIRDSFPKGTVYGEGETKEQRWASDAALITRLVFPVGVNTINADGNPEKPSSHDVGKLSTIHFGHPQRDDSIPVWVVPFPQFESTILSADFAKKRPVRLADEAMFAGRSFTLKHIFGLELPVVVKVPVRAQMGSSKVSRAAVMLVRHNGCLYIFDSGSQNRIYPEQEDQVIEYNPQELASGIFRAGDDERKEELPKGTVQAAEPD